QASQTFIIIFPSEKIMWMDGSQESEMFPMKAGRETMDRQNKGHERKRSLRLVEKYDNDDYSRYAGPDYTDQPFEIGEEEEFLRSAHSDKKNIRLRPQGNWDHP